MPASQVARSAPWALRYPPSRPIENCSPPLLAGPLGRGGTYWGSGSSDRTPAAGNGYSSASDVGRSVLLESQKAAIRIDATHSMDRDHLIDCEGKASEDWVRAPR